MSCQWEVIFQKEFCFLAIGLSSGLKIFRKPCYKQICRHPGFVVLFIEHRQKRFSVILRGLRILGMVNEHWLYLSYQLHQPLTVSLSFDLEGRHWLLLSSYGSPRWHLLSVEACFIYTEKLLLNVATSNNDLSSIFWITATASSSALTALICLLKS